MSPRPLLTAALALALAVLISACGESSESADPAAIASPNALVYVEGNLRPDAELKADVDAAAERIAGIDDLGQFIVEKLEEEAGDDDEPVDFEREVEPWLGERAGISFDKLVDGDLANPLLAFETTDVEATEKFIEAQVKRSDEPVTDHTYEGIAYKVGGPEEDAIGVIGDLFVIAETGVAFERAVDAEEGESLADLDRFQTAIGAASNASLADVYVDVGGIVAQSEGGIDDDAEPILKGAGIDPTDATAVASIIPAEDRIEVELSSDLGGQEAPTGDASELLGEMPADSFAAIGFSGFGKQLGEAIDSLDRSGIPGEVPPGQLKEGLKPAGIDLDQIGDSLGDAAVFAQGRSEATLGGALVLRDDSGKAVESVAGLGSLLRATDTPGVTAISGKASGFSVRDEDLGEKPLVVVAKGERIAIGYGLAPALQGVAAPSGSTLADTPAYKEAVAALGDTPISAFAAGPAALRLADALLPASDSDFEALKPYLAKISSIGVGTSTDGDLATARLIASLE